MLNRVVLTIRYLLYAAPTFMHEAIETYMATVSPVPNGTFNTSNRGYPDVAMLGKNCK